MTAGNCRHCGTALEQAKYRKPRTFCDLHCFILFAKANPETKLCSWCGNEFEDPRRLSQNRFCSSHCARDDYAFRADPDRSCRWCPREPGENRMLSRTQCRTCHAKREHYGTCRHGHCGRILRPRGFGRQGPGLYCPRHEGPDLWHRITDSVRVLLVDRQSGLLRICYRLNSGKTSTPEWDGRIGRAAQDRSVIMLVDRDAFVSRETRWALAIKGISDPRHRLDRYPWSIFTVDEVGGRNGDQIRRSIRDAMTACIAAGSPVSAVGFGDQFKDATTMTTNRRWERFKHRIADLGIEHRRLETQQDNSVPIAFDETQWESWIAFTDQRVLQRQDKSLWI